MQPYKVHNRVQKAPKNLFVLILRRVLMSNKNFWTFFIKSFPEKGRFLGKRVDK